MAGGSSVWSLAAAGHTDLATSQRYIAGANLLREGKFGEPHPPLPESLLGENRPGDSPEGVELIQAAVILDEKWRSQRELNPRSRRERPVS
jgi:hypothetical protein